MRILVGLLSLLVAMVPLGAQTPSWTLSWSDEFDGTSLDAGKWVFDIGNSNGWGNAESEYYTDRPQNLTIENGNLVIHALQESYGGKTYTSARIKTYGKFSQAYGRVEARIRIPYGQGLWPAFWMLGDDINTAGWPQCGELDIMENIGKEPAIVHGTAHGPGYSGSNGIGASYSLPGNTRFADDFHVYAIEWEPAAVRWYVDNALYKTLTPKDLPANAKWVFDHPFFILLNVAVGGSWPGYPDATTVFPQTMQVDYVRVYTAAPAPKPAVAAVVNGAGYQASIAPGSWFTVFGTNLATNARVWRGDEIVNGALPTQLDGTQVLVNGSAAYVYYISPGQVNAQAPDTATGPGTVQVVVNGTASDTATATVQTYSPAFFLDGAHPNHVLATTPDFAVVRTAKPGDVLILWGTGFGPVNPPVAPGSTVTGAPELTAAPTILVGSQTADYLGAAMTPGTAGLYQINIRVPASAPSGDLALVAQIGGVTSPDTTLLTVAQ